MVCLTSVFSVHSNSFVLIHYDLRRFSLNSCLYLELFYANSLRCTEYIKILSLYPYNIEGCSGKRTNLNCKVFKYANIFSSSSAQPFIWKRLWSKINEFRPWQNLNSFDTIFCFLTFFLYVCIFELYDSTLFKTITLCRIHWRCT